MKKIMMAFACLMTMVINIDAQTILSFDLKKPNRVYAPDKLTTKTPGIGSMNKNDAIGNVYGVWRSNIDKITFVICKDSIVIKTDNESVTLLKDNFDIGKEIVYKEYTYHYHFDIPILGTYQFKYTFCFELFDDDLMVITVYDDNKHVEHKYKAIKQK